MMAGVQPNRCAPDLTNLLKQREKIAQFLKSECDVDESDDLSGAEEVQPPTHEDTSEACENKNLEKETMNIRKTVHVKENKGSDVFEGELKIIENTESENIPMEIPMEYKGKGKKNGQDRAPAINDLKSTINEVFWDKINSHVEELLNTYDSDPKINNSDDLEQDAQKIHIPEQPKISCQQLNSVACAGELKSDTPPKFTWPKEIPYSPKSPCQRRSMLEISSLDIDDNLISIFRRDMHCTDACVIRVVDKSGIFRQSHINRTIPMVCIDRSLLRDNIARLKPATYLRIIRMQNEGSIAVFQSSDVFAKRSVIKGGDILRTLAVYEMREKFDFEEQHTMDKETRKVMYNKFTNMQRLDRGVGSRLKWQFMERHNIEETDTIECLEEKANVSFSIFGTDGYLSYESKKYRIKHVSMIKDGAGLYYFIPQKMLSAFGSQWNRRYRSDRYFKSKIKSEGGSPISTDVSPAVSPTNSQLPPAKGRENRVKAEVKRKVNSATPLSTKPSKSGTESTVKDLLAEKILESRNVLPNDGMSWRKIRDRKCEIHRNVAKAETPGSVSKKELPEVEVFFSADKKVEGPSVKLVTRYTPSVSRPVTVPSLPLERKASLDVSGTIAAVPRVSNCNVPTVRLLPMGGKSLKRSPESGSSPKKRVHAIKRILTKGEVLLTTKDHIIFRIPRSVDLNLVEGSEPSAGERS